MGTTFSIDDIGQDTLDSIEIQKLYDDLVSEQEDLEQAIKDAREDLKLAQADYDPADGDESVDDALTALDDAEHDLEHFITEHSGIMRDIEDAMEQVGEDWKYGIELINERYWEDFVQQDLEEMGYISKDAWFIEVDWKRTAENIAMDYTTVDLGDHTYYARSC